MPTPKHPDAQLVIGSTRPDFWLNPDGTETPIDNPFPAGDCDECGRRLSFGCIHMANDEPYPYEEDL